MPPRKKSPGKSVARQSAEVAHLPVRRGGKNRIEVLVHDGAALLRNYAAVETSKTAILKELAKVVVELRTLFATEDGSTDWSGRSHGYREAVARIYRDAGLPPDSMGPALASLRYHVSNVLRDVAPPEELEDKGLRKEPARERVAITRARTAALAKTALAIEGSGNAPADAVRLIVGAEAVLARVRDDALAEVPAEKVPDLIEALDGIRAQAADLKAVLRRRRGR